MWTLGSASRSGFSKVRTHWAGREKAVASTSTLRTEPPEAHCPYGTRLTGRDTAGVDCQVYARAAVDARTTSRTGTTTGCPVRPGAPSIMQSRCSIAVAPSTRRGAATVVRPGVTRSATNVFVVAHNAQVLRTRTPMRAKPRINPIAIWAL
jgi:hypothetical protein